MVICYPRIVPDLYYFKTMKMLNLKITTAKHQMYLIEGIALTCIIQFRQNDAWGNLFTRLLSL